MKYLWKLYDYELKRPSWLYSGVIIVILLYIPTLILGGNSHLIIHDQLDSEVTNYMLVAKHLFEATVPEMFDGSMKPVLPAPGMVIFYMVFSPLHAFLISKLLIAVFAFIGMYLLIRLLTQSNLLALLISFIFSILPFYPVYGLSVMGQPFLAYGILAYLKDRIQLKISMYIAALFAAFSSPVLVGYADCAFLGMVILFLWGRKDKKGFGLLFILLTIIASYLLCNLQLITNVFHPSAAQVLHRVETIVPAINVKTSFWSILTDGMYHAEARHIRILYLTCIVLFLSFIPQVSHKINSETKKTFYVLCLLVISIALFYSFWHCSLITSYRNHSKLAGGLLKMFQADRFYWLYPVLWYSIFAMDLYMISKLVKRHLSTIAILILCFAQFAFVFQGSYVKQNIKALLGRNVTTVTWNQFFSPDLFETARIAIGKKQNEYKVCSIGLYPSIALFNGFYCIDGYSNAYPLKYKHEFRNIISGELDKNKRLKLYFDNWGNRCYIFLSKVPFNYMVRKNSNLQLDDLGLNISAMRALGCQYIFSTIKITDPKILEEIVLMDTLVDRQSPYSLYLYKIT